MIISLPKSRSSYEPRTGKGAALLVWTVWRNGVELAEKQWTVWLNGVELAENQGVARLRRKSSYPPL